MLLEIGSFVVHVMQQKSNSLLVAQLVKVAAVYSLCCPSYQHCLPCYLKGESPHTGNFTVHYKYPVHATIFPFFSSAATNFLIADFLRPLLLSFFFSERCVTILWFPYHSQCTGSVLSQNRSLSLFPLLSEDHSAKFTPNNKITGAQNIFFHIHRGLI